jgi:NNP family nitrate/nitrite transporter-like MFS transporter
LQAWASFFCAWISTFSPAALLPVIREDLNLTTFDIGNAGIAALVGAIAGDLPFRCMMFSALQ